ncbi:hypothetical protein POM88_053618 [Heracleum sosnowskyi]|uniref:Uncharacterized protein n=1 Tax=Heracleum sosnowskyi TaxID=360622 RepID=A0AAD8LXS8_9APIA|nr:hypothetical protein POM88_053618 [Heracleum sosnowskyi]
MLGAVDFSRFFDLVNWDDRFLVLMIHLNELGVADGVLYIVSRQLWLQEVSLDVGSPVIEELGNLGHGMSRLFNPLFQLAYDVGNAQQAYNHLMSLFDSSTFLSTLESHLHSLKLIKFSLVNILHVVVNWDDRFLVLMIHLNELGVADGVLYIVSRQLWLQEVSLDVGSPVIEELGNLGHRMSRLFNPLFQLAYDVGNAQQAYNHLMSLFDSSTFLSTLESHLHSLKLIKFSLVNILHVAVNWDDRFLVLMIHLNELGVADGVLYIVSRQLWLQEVSLDVGSPVIEELGNLGHRMSRLFNPLFQLAYDVGNAQQAYNHLMSLFDSSTFLSTLESHLHSLKLIKFSLVNILHVAVNWDDRFLVLMIHLNELGVADGVLYIVSRQLWLQEVSLDVGSPVIEELGNLGHRMSRLFNPLFQLAYDVGNAQQAYNHLMSLFDSSTFLSTLESHLHSLKLIKFSLVNILHVAVNWDDRFLVLMIHLNELGVADGVLYIVSRQLWLQEVSLDVGSPVIEELGNLGHRMSRLFNPLFQLAYDVGNAQQAYNHLMSLFDSSTFLSTLESHLHSLKLIKFSLVNILHVAAITPHEKENDSTKMGGGTYLQMPPAIIRNHGECPSQITTF